MRKREKLHYVTLYMKSGAKIRGYYADDEYDGIYDAWSYKRTILYFRNCEVITSEVACIEWGL